MVWDEPSASVIATGGGASGRRGRPVPADSPEVPAVDRRDVGGAQALGDRDRRGVRGAQREVCVLPYEVGHPGEVLRGGGLDDQLAARQRVEERGLDCVSGLDLDDVGGRRDPAAETQVRIRPR